MSHASSPAVDRVDDTVWTRAMSVTLLAGASFAFSLAFACATPFAGLAAVAALRMRRRDALAAVTLAWIINQANGFLLLHYPWTWSTAAWGGAIWIAAIAAAGVAFVPTLLSPSGRRAPVLSPVLVQVLVQVLLQVLLAGGALAGAFFAYEAVLIAATLILPAEPSSFSIAVMGRLFVIDVAAFGLLLALMAVVRTRRIGAPLHSTAAAADS